MTAIIPETYTNKDWPRRVAQAVNHLLRKVGGVAITDDGELFITETERELNVYVNHSVTNHSASSYAALIDLSDTTNFPHDEAGRLDLSAIYISVDRDSTGTGLIRVGVVKAINGTSATIGWFMGLNFDKSNEQHITRDRIWTPSQLKCDVVAGATPHMLVTTVSGITAINTATALDSPRGAATVTPAVGDIVIEYNRTAGSYNASVGCFYHGQP